MKKILTLLIGACIFSFLLSPSLSVAAEEGNGSQDSAPPANGTPTDGRDSSSSPTVNKEKTKQGLDKIWKKLSPEKDNSTPVAPTGSNPDAH